MWQDYVNEAFPNTVAGQLRLLPEVHSPQLDNVRSILVHLPPSYHTETTRVYPVIYMQDGQNLFDQQIAFGNEWRVDEILVQLADEGLEAITVGVANNDARLDEYSPFTDPEYGGGKGDAYLAFIAETIKPIIDRDFRTQAGRDSTGILGSSMGGLISLYGFLARPDVFGFAGGLSPALWFADEALTQFVTDLAQPPQGKLYLDAGWKELRGVQNARCRSREYVDVVRRLRDSLLEKGYQQGRDLLYMEDRAGAHQEQDWSRRLPDALRFLLRS